MTRYITWRLASAVLVVFGVSVVTFLFLHLEPGSAARTLLGEHATPRAIAALQKQWGLNASLFSQFIRFISGLFHGNLGTSYIYQVPASQLIGERIGLTASLVGLAALFAILITVPLATLAASRKNKVADHAVRGITVIGLGLPAFWFGIVLIEIFSVHLHLLPVGGIGSGPAGYLESLILPAITAAIGIVPILVRSLRVGMIEILDAEFVATARAKGLSERFVLFSVVARNAVVPTVTFLGLNIAYLVGSTVIVEQVFNLNGLGSLLLNSILNRDFPVVQAVTIVLGTSVVLINLCTDLAAARLDPRIRLR
jgi:peptide/nickel transport system permease protein